MKRWIENYGEDIDGTRGMQRVCYEIEESDRPEIKQQVLEFIDECGESNDPEEELEVVLIDPVTEEDVYLTIRIKDYV